MTYKNIYITTVYACQPLAINTPETRQRHAEPEEPERRGLRVTTVDGANKTNGGFKLKSGLHEGCRVVCLHHTRVYTTHKE